jgi:hypothetical protein
VKILKHYFKAKAFTCASYLCPLILQYSPPRSGSTLIYNYVREYKKRFVIKSHTLVYTSPWTWIICTYRNPLDCISSAILIEKHNPSNDYVSRLADYYLQHLQWVEYLNKKKNALTLKYELFINNHYTIFEEIEKKFNITIDCNKQKLLTSEYSLSNVAKKIKESPDFASYDKKTQFHGNHISRYKGKSHYEKVLKQEQVMFLKNKFYDFMYKHYPEAL